MQVCYVHVVVYFAFVVNISVLYVCNNIMIVIILIVMWFMNHQAPTLIIQRNHFTLKIGMKKVSMLLCTYVQ